MNQGLVHFWVLFGTACAGAQPVLDCGPVVVDVGAVPQGRVVRMERTCRNASAAEVSLIPPSTACSCLSARFDRRKLAPGAKARLLMVLETDPLADRVEFAVDLSVRPEHIAQTLMVSANVRPSVIAVPEYVDMGDYRRNPVRQVLIVDTTGRSFSIRQAATERSEVDVRWTPVELVRMGNHWEPSTSRGAVNGYQITITAHAQPGRKSLSDEIELLLSHDSQKSLRLRVVGYSP
jgi:hypothetical protein